MTIDARLREAAQEARTVAGGVDVPAPSRARRAARWRGPLAAAAAAALVLVTVVAVALLRDGAAVPPSVAPAGPEATAPPAEETADAVPVIPEGAVRVPIGGAGAAAADAARRAAEDTEGAPAVVLGAVGETVLLTVALDGGVQCLVVADLPALSSDCALGGPAVNYTISQLPDDSHRAAVGGKLPPGATVVVVTAGDTTYAQVARDGWVYVPLDTAARPLRVEARAPDGRVVAPLPVSDDLEELVEMVLRAQLLGHLAALGPNPDPLEQAVLDAQAQALEGGIVTGDEADTLDELVAVGEQRLEAIRAEVLARPPPEPAEGLPAFPVPEDVAAAIGDPVALAAAPVPGLIWVAGGADDPARLFAIDPSTGRLVASYEIGPVRLLAAGSSRVWFAGPGTAGAGSVGYLDVDTGAVERVETGILAADIVLADAAGAAAYLVGRDGEEQVVARLGPGPVPAPLPLDWDAAELVAGAAWPGGLLAADISGRIWRVDASTASATQLAELGGIPIVLTPVTLATGEPGGWALVSNGAGVQAVAFGGHDAAVEMLELPEDAHRLAGAGGDQAFVLTMSGEVLLVATDGPPEVVARVDPGSSESSFGALEAFGPTLWLMGGDARLAWLNLGQ